MARICVVFPGIGYHTDKPLLYYGKRVAVSHGYECKDVPYKNFPADVKGSRDKMAACFETALEQTREILKDVDFDRYEKILFLSKSIGTAVAAAYAEERHLATENLYFTPVEETFRFPLQPGIAFHGTADSWADTEKIKAGCEACALPLHIFEGASHSLETGDWAEDLAIQMRVMRLADRYLAQRDA